MSNFLKSNFVKNFYKKIFNREIIFYSVIIGVLSGLSASLFYYLLEFAKHFINVYIAGKSLTVPVGEHIFFNFGESLNLSHVYFLLPAIGAFISGLLVYFFAPSAKGNGTDATIKAFHREKGRIEPKVPFIKSLASIFVISTNGSSGREGPILQICGGIGSYLARLLNKNTFTKRIFLLAGAAGGLGAIFRAPLGGAITSIEVLYREDFETEALLPCIISSVTAYTVFTAIFGHKPIFDVGVIGFHSSEIPIYIILGFLCAFLGRMYINIFDYVSEKAESLNGKMKPYFITLIGGLLVGFVGYFVPQSLGSGDGFIQEAFFGKFALLTFILIAFAKMLTTSLTLGSGSSGGVFGPSLVIGAMIGGGFASVFETYMPGMIEYPSSFIVVGMGSFFAGIASAPIASIIMVCEITQSYALLPPLLLVSVISIMFSKKSIFKNQVKNRLFSMAHHQETAECLLKQKKVKDHSKKFKEDDIVNEDLSIEDLMDKIESSHNSDFIVVDKDFKLKGGISISSIKSCLSKFNKTCDHKNLKVKDIAKKISFVYEEDDLYFGLQRLLHESFYKMPVLDEEDTLVAYIRYRDVLTSL
jgi:chloride channel protein, CIC family